MSKEQKLVFLAKYLVVFYGLVMVIFVFLKSRNQSDNFVLKDELLYNRRVLGSDVCSRSIYGEPEGAGENYVKVNFLCKEESASNTLAIGALADNKIKTAVDEVLRINKLEMPPDFECFYEERKIEDNNLIFEKGKTIECREINETK